MGIIDDLIYDKAHFSSLTQHFKEYKTLDGRQKKTEKGTNENLPESKKGMRKLKTKVNVLVNLRNHRWLKLTEEEEI